MKTGESRANMNIKALFASRPLEGAMWYGGGTIDHEPASMVEKKLTFKLTMDKCTNSGKSEIVECLKLYGVIRKLLTLGDHLHLANKAVGAASKGAFGALKRGGKEQHRQAHHLQLLESIHDLHSHNPSLSQKIMDMELQGASGQVDIRTCRVREDRWNVNQEFSERLLDGQGILTAGGLPAYSAWSKTWYALADSQAWYKQVAGEISTWLNMKSLILGLHFEKDLGMFFGVVIH